MRSGPAAVYSVVNDLMHVLADALNATQSPVLQRVGIVPGAIAWDLCDCGSLSLSVNNQYLADTFPHTTSTRTPVELTPCRAAWVVIDVLIQVIRCAPSIKSNEISVSSSVLEESAITVLSDAWIVLNLVACTLEDMKTADTIIDYSVSNQIFLGPEGGCVGSELTVSFALARGM